MIRNALAGTTLNYTKFLSINPVERMGLQHSTHCIENSCRDLTPKIKLPSINSVGRMGLQHFTYFIANFGRDLSFMLSIETLAV